MVLDTQQIEAIAERAAERALENVMGQEEIKELVAETVRQTLLQLGIDSANPIEMQRDFQHLREWRTAGTELKRKGMLALMGIFFSGVITLLVLGFKTWGKT